MIRKLFMAFLGVLCAVGVAVQIGCEEDVTGVIGTERAFTLYGVLNPEADTQFVRVFPIQNTLELGKPEKLQATFTSTNQETGEERTWTDSLVNDPLGGTGHVYWSPFAAEYGHTYLLKISGGEKNATSSVDVQVPGEAELTLEEPKSTGSVVLPVRIEGEVPHLVKPEVELWVQYATGYTMDGLPITENYFVTIPYREHVVKTSHGWSIGVNLSDGYRSAYAALPNPEEFELGYGIVLFRVEFRTIAANEEWEPPNGQFDPEVLVEPNIMSNVDNGFGFVGSGYRLRHRWLPDDEIVRDAGFRTIRDITSE